MGQAPLSSSRGTEMGDALPRGHPLRNAGGQDPTAVTVRAGMPEPRLEVSEGPRADCTSLREELSNGGVGGEESPASHREGTVQAVL